MSANIADLVKEHQELKAAYEADQKKFDNHWKPAKERMEQEIYRRLENDTSLQGALLEMIRKGDP